MQFPNRAFRFSTAIGWFLSRYKLSESKCCYLIAVVHGSTTWNFHTNTNIRHIIRTLSYISQIARISYRLKISYRVCYINKHPAISVSVCVCHVKGSSKRQCFCLFICLLAPQFQHRYSLNFKLWIQARVLTDYNFTVQLRTQMASSKSNYVRMKPHSPLFIIIICELWHSTACSFNTQTVLRRANTHTRHWICSHRKYHYPYNRCMGGINHKWGYARDIV